MVTNLTLPILCSYYPYRVNIVVSHRNQPDRITKLMLSYLHCTDGVKLLLRPMSDLDKPLEELGGKSMMNWLNDLIVHTFEVEGKETVTEEFLELMKEYDWMLPEKARTKLLSLHFDIFGLLESGDALNLNEILNETKG